MKPKKTLHNYKPLLIVKSVVITAATAEGMLATVKHPQQPAKAVLDRSSRASDRHKHCKHRGNLIGETLEGL